MWEEQTGGAAGRGSRNEHEGHFQKLRICTARRVWDQKRDPNHPESSAQDEDEVETAGLKLRMDTYQGSVIANGETLARSKRTHPPYRLWQQRSGPSPAGR